MVMDPLFGFMRQKLIYMGINHNTAFKGNMFQNLSGRSSASVCILAHFHLK